MDRFDFYFRQLLTEAELDGAFDAVEEAINGLSSAAAIIGLAQNGAVSEKAGTPNLSVDVSAPLVAYDSDGNRIEVGTAQNIDVSIDENSVSTAVTTGGFEKYLSVFVKFERSLSDPRLDGNGATVYFSRESSYEFAVVQGVEASAGTATRPALRADSILLADILIANGTTQVLNANISTTRTQYVVTTPSAAPQSIQARTYLEAIRELQDQINDIINGAISVDADFVTVDPAGTITSTDVQAALEELDTDIGNIVSGTTDITFAPTGDIAAETVAAALAELDGDKARLAGGNTFSGGDQVVSTNNLRVSAGGIYTGATPPTDTNGMRCAQRIQTVGIQVVSGSHVEFVGNGRVQWASGQQTTINVTNSPSFYDFSGGVPGWIKNQGAWSCNVADQSIHFPITPWVALGNTLQSIVLELDLAAGDRGTGIPYEVLYVLGNYTGGGGAVIMKNGNTTTGGSVGDTVTTNINMTTGLLNGTSNLISNLAHYYIKLGGGAGSVATGSKITRVLLNGQITELAMR